MGFVQETCSKCSGTGLAWGGGTCPYCNGFCFETVHKNDPVGPVAGGGGSSASGFGILIFGSLAVAFAMTAGLEGPLAALVVGFGLLLAGVGTLILMLRGIGTFFRSKLCKMFILAGLAFLLIKMLSSA
ncbi:hypothetical protein [Erythrobacter sp. SD-21]|uniref:hypothetical protein n=1 Tax=Erythrobacter sp. SD-21 TaxID=161528 RepID=UPI0018DC06D2|nr:hypothetical protein [Erythrobacter sp. SD-21]